MKAAVPVTPPVRTLLQTLVQVKEHDDEAVKVWLRSSHRGEEGGSVLAHELICDTGSRLDSSKGILSVYIMRKGNAELYTLGASEMVKPEVAENELTFHLFQSLACSKTKNDGCVSHRKKTCRFLLTVRASFCITEEVV